MTFCIRQYRDTYQAAVSLGTWNICKVKPFGPVFKSFDEAQAHINRAMKRSIKP